MRILYVEDHAVFANMVTSQFLTGHDVTIAPSLAAARDASIAGFDVLLVDYDLPDGKGEEFVREVRAEGHSVRIVAVSAHDRGNAALVEAGADVICRKAELHLIAAALVQS